MSATRTSTTTMTSCPQWYLVGLIALLIGTLSVSPSGVVTPGSGPAPATAPLDRSPETAATGGGSRDDRFAGHVDRTAGIY